MPRRMRAGPWIAATIALATLVVVLVAIAAALLQFSPRSVVATREQPRSLP